jgi:hypothetical protein
MNIIRCKQDRYNELDETEAVVISIEVSKDA